MSTIGGNGKTQVTGQNPSKHSRADPFNALTWDEHLQRAHEGKRRLVDTLDILAGRRNVDAM